MSKEELDRIHESMADMNSAIKELTVAIVGKPDGTVKGIRAEISENRTNIEELKKMVVIGNTRIAGVAGGVGAVLGGVVANAKTFIEIVTKHGGN